MAIGATTKKEKKVKMFNAVWWACPFAGEKYYAEISTKRGKSFGAVAQLVERFHGMEEARGSIPLSSTIVCLVATNR